MAEKRDGRQTGGGNDAIGRADNDVADLSAAGTGRITALILLGLLLGGVAGEMLYRVRLNAGEYAGAVEALHFVGSDIFLGLLKMIIVPLIISSIITGIASIGDVRNLGRIGAKTLVYYVTTMVIAVIIGLGLVGVVNPGESIDPGDRLQAAEQYAASDVVQERIVRNQDRPGGIPEALMQIVRTMIPTNPIAAAADPGIAALPVIFFSILFGAVLTTLGHRSSVVVDFFEVVFRAMTVMVRWILYLAPLGVFSLVAWSVARIGLESFAGGMFAYAATVVAGLSIHGLVILPLVLFLFTRTDPFRFMVQMRSALMTAFGTDSSSATLPVTIDAAVRHGGCTRKAAGFVLPLGATINMDGTALFEAVAVVFIAQAFGVELGLDQLIVIALMSTLTAVGAAGIPSASLVMIPVIIGAVNQMAGPTGTTIPIEGLGLILGIDRLLDMCRTTVNVWGDAVGAKIISHSEPDAEPAGVTPEGAT